ASGEPRTAAGSTSAISRVTPTSKRVPDQLVRLNCCEKSARSEDCCTSSKGSESIGGGVCQCSRSKAEPLGKKIENWPPSGPIQKRSSPPKALMCGRISRAATSSRLIQPKLAPGSPSAVLVATRPCQAGTSATC